MKRAFIIAGACVLFAAPALAQSPNGQTNSPSAPQSTAAAQASQPSQSTPSTADFVKTAAISDMFEIESSKLALRKRVAADRTFARRMVHDHTKTTAELKRLVRSGKVDAPLPTALDSEHQQMLDQLRKESGESFDKAYDQMQLKGHQDAVALFQSYAQNGDNPALKRWAAKTLPHLQEHLAMAQKLS